MALSTWYHYASTYKASTSLAMSYYVNGVENNSATRTSMNTGTGPFAIGKDPTKTSISYFEGSLSDFRL